MELSANSAPQHGESEKCIISFSPRSGVNTQIFKPQYGDHSYMYTYEEESVNRSHIDTKRKICDIRT
jgi:hypothetical protein